MGDAGDNSGATYVTVNPESNLPNSQLISNFATRTPTVLAVYSTEVDVTNTVTETDLISYTVPANLLGTTNILRLTLFGNYENNSGTPTMTLKIKYGATTMYADATGALGAIASIKGGWYLIANLGNVNVTNAQNLNGFITIGPRVAATTGFGDLATASSIALPPIGGTAAENSATALTLKVTAQWSSAITSAHWRMSTGMIEIISTNSNIAGPTVLSKSVTDNDIANTASETNLFLYSVPAGTLGTNGIIRVTMTGTYAANSGTPTMIFRVYYGATTMWADTTFTVSAVALVGAWEIIIYLSAHNATNLQELSGKISFGNRAAATTGVGDIASTSSGPSHPLEGTAAEDSTTALNFKMSVQWSAAQATYTWKVKTLIIELL